MTYRILYFEKVVSSITVKIGTQELTFRNGKELAEYEFKRQYMVSNMAGEGIVIQLTEA